MVAMTTYTVTAERGTSGAWIFQCVEAPGAISQGRRLTDAKRLMPEAIAFVTGVNEASVEISVMPMLHANLRDEIVAARKAVATLVAQQERTAMLSRIAVRHLRESGFTGTDAAEVLGVSPQRVSQLSRS
jgi:predicted RNase H-like HicB family nuclease